MGQAQERQPASGGASAALVSAPIGAPQGGLAIAAPYRLAGADKTPLPPAARRRYRPHTYRGAPRRRRDGDAGHHAPPGRRSGGASSTEAGSLSPGHRPARLNYSPRWTGRLKRGRDTCRTGRVPAPWGPRTHRRLGRVDSGGGWLTESPLGGAAPARAAGAENTRGGRAERRDLGRPADAIPFCQRHGDRRSPTHAVHPGRRLFPPQQGGCAGRLPGPSVRIPKGARHGKTDAQFSRHGDRR